MLQCILRSVLSFICLALICNFNVAVGQSAVGTSVDGSATEAAIAVQQEIAGEKILDGVQNGNTIARSEFIKPIYRTVAILPFQQKGENLAATGKQVADLLFANLAASPQLILVDRGDLDKVFQEQKLSLTGLVNPQEQVILGQFTGAKLLVTGSVLEINESIHLVAKVIGTETTRVTVVSVSGKMSDDLSKLTKSLAHKVIEQIDTRGDDLLAKPVNKIDALAALKQKLGDGPKPTIEVTVQEQHISALVIDPAVETELISTLLALGFEVVGSGETENEPEFLIEGEAFSEFATRTQDLVSVRARVELKVTDLKASKVVAAGQQTETVVDLSENIAGKTALQNAAFDLGIRLIPELLEIDQ